MRILFSLCFILFHIFLLQHVTFYKTWWYGAVKSTFPLICSLFSSCLLPTILSLSTFSVSTKLKSTICWKRPLFHSLLESLCTKFDSSIMKRKCSLYLYKKLLNNLASFKVALVTLQSSKYSGTYKWCDIIWRRSRHSIIS